MKKNINQYFKNSGAFCYLTFGYLYIIFNLFNGIMSACMPLGWLALIFYTYFLIFVYCLINHFLINKIVSWDLVTIEIFLIFSVTTILWSDQMILRDINNHTYNP